jgi:hypothetical protein
MFGPTEVSFSSAQSRQQADCAIATAGDGRLPQPLNVPAIAQTIFACTGDTLFVSLLRDEGDKPGQMDGTAIRCVMFEQRTRWTASVRAGAITVG